MVEDRITWLAAMLDDEGRKELLEYGELLFVRQIAAEETEERPSIFATESGATGARNGPTLR